MGDFADDLMLEFEIGCLFAGFIASAASMMTVTCRVTSSSTENRLSCLEAVILGSGHQRAM